MFGSEDWDADVIEIWPENMESVQFFVRLSTQWRHGMSGPTGLDYASVLALLRTQPRERRDELFDDVQVMEQAALNEIHQK